MQIFLSDIFVAKAVLDSLLAFEKELQVYNFNVVVDTVTLQIEGSRIFVPLYVLSLNVENIVFRRENNVQTSHN